MIASLIRIKFIPTLGQSSSSFYSNALGLGSWSLIELGCGIIAASLATLRPLFRNILRPIRKMQSRSSTPNKLRKARDSNESHRPFVRKSSISKPYESIDNRSRTSLYSSHNYHLSIPDSAATITGEWDRATLIESHDWDALLRKDSLGELSPLPRIAPLRVHKVNEVLRSYELSPLRPGSDRRNSYPG